MSHQQSNPSRAVSTTASGKLTRCQHGVQHLKRTDMPHSSSSLHYGEPKEVPNDRTPVVKEIMHGLVDPDSTFLVETILLSRALLEHCIFTTATTEWVRAITCKNREAATIRQTGIDSSALIPLSRTTTLSYSMDTRNTTTIQLPDRRRVNPPATSTPRPSATEQVLCIPELLEAILYNLPQKELLLSQRVSRRFRSTIVESVRLQRALFLAPDWNHAAKATTTRTQKPANNRLLLRAFPGGYPTVTLVLNNDPPSTRDIALGRSGDGGEDWRWEVCISFPADRAPNTNPAVLYPEASWRRMYLSQPPCTSLHLMRRWQRSLNPAIVREGGIRMGEFVDEATRSRVMGNTPSFVAPQTNTSAGVSADSSILSSLPGRRWHRSYIASDRDWHFEGSIACNNRKDEGEIEVDV